MSETNKGFNQIEYCNFVDKIGDTIGHPIKNNVGYITVKEIFSELLNCTETLYEISFDEDEETQDYYKNLIKRAKECL